MATTVTRIPASFRFQSTLMDELKRRAKASNRSLNNYVESLLISVLHPEASDKDIITPELQIAANKTLSELNGGNSGIVR